MTSAITGAGAYSLPLAAPRAGHRPHGRADERRNPAAVRHQGQALGTTHPIISKLYNEAWVRPAEDEGIANKEAVEGGSYW